MLLPPKHIETQPIGITNKPPKHIETQPIGITNKYKEKLKATPTELQPAKKSVNAEKKLRKLHAEELHAELPYAEPENKTDKSLPISPEQIKELNQNNVLFTEICKYLANLADHNQSTNVYLCSSRAANNLLYKNNKLWVANDLRLDVIREVHDQTTVCHVGVKKRMLLIQQYYFWLRIK